MDFSAGARHHSKWLTVVRRLLAAGLLCLLGGAGGAFARSLADYRAGLENAGGSVDALMDYADEQEQNAADERELLADIRRNVPVTEKIEWEGTSIETNNQWLETDLKAFEAETKDAKKRALILKNVDERLSALIFKIRQLEKPAASGPSKDEDKRKLAEILRRAEYQKAPEQEESWFQKLMKQIREWLRDKFPEPEIPQNAPAGMQTLSFGLQMLLYAVVFGFIAFLIYRFGPFFAGKLRRRRKEEKGDRVILGERLAADEDAHSLFGEAEELARQGNLRGAIRKGYIALLCELSDRRVIGLAQHKTNRDYLRDVRRREGLYRNMNGLTLSYERHWYGFDEADEADWNEFRQTYQQALNSEQ
ncbi:MAG: DUF4129 domain-containing protein [Acidobacteria bacterium]|nr:DUF4129 domain-containing protein [Acidobacteriota bacterium]